jgi:hypothetical protein
MELGWLICLAWLYLAGAWMADMFMIRDFVKYAAAKDYEPPAGFLFLLIMAWPLIAVGGWLAILGIKLGVITRAKG